MSQIADKYKVSRKTVYRWRDGVRKKYKKFEKRG
ncbi:helix-turn-helix domain-containing protein [Vagococcus martis]